jgi:hypothetical protein
MDVNNIKSELSEAISSPIIFWAEKEFNWSPIDPPYGIRWYQYLFLHSAVTFPKIDKCKRCTSINIKQINKNQFLCIDCHNISFSSIKILLRGGRQIGKTDCIAIICLYLALTCPIYEPIIDFNNPDKISFRKRGAAIIVASAYEKMVITVWNRVLDLIHRSPKYSKAFEEGIIEHKLNPRYLKFPIIGSKAPTIDFTGPGENGEAPRSKTYDYKFYDESDRMPDSFWIAEKSTSINTQSAITVLSSTPVGWKKHFYLAATSPEWGYKEYHFPSHVNPRFTKEIDDEHKQQLPESQYIHEILADWGETEGGVFSIQYLSRCLKNYDEYSKIEMNEEVVEFIKKQFGDFRIFLNSKITPRNRECNYIMGCDFGYSQDPSEFLIFEVRNNIKRLICRINFTNVKYDTQCEILAKLEEIFNFDFIAVDKGNGGLVLTQVLKSDELKWSKYNFDKKLYAIDFGGKLEIPLDKVSIMHKEFMTNVILKWIEDEEIIFPAISIDPDIEFQFRNQTYHLSPNGTVVYSKGNDHIIDACRCIASVLGRKNLKPQKRTKLPTGRFIHYFGH